MTKPLRHTKHEIEQAARMARELGVVVRLETDGAITFLPEDHAPQLDITPNTPPKSLADWRKRHEGAAGGRA